MTDETLSLDAAIASLNALDDQPQLNSTEEPTTGAEIATEEAHHEIDSQDDPDLDPDFEPGTEGSPEDEVEEDEGSDEALPPLEAPKFWEPQYRDRFATLPREAQELVAEQAKHSHDVVTKAVNEAALSRKAAETEAQNLQASHADLQNALKQAGQMFASKWANVDESQWLAAMAQDPQATLAARQQYEAEKAALAQLEDARQKAEVQALQAHRETQSKTLNEIKSNDKIAAKLLDAARTPEVQQELSQFLRDRSIPEAALQNATAGEIVILLEAMEYRKAMKRASEKRQPGAGQKPSKPSAGMRVPTAPAKSTSVSRVESQSRRLSQTGSAEDAIALLNMRDAQRSK